MLGTEPVIGLVLTVLVLVGLFRLATLWIPESWEDDDEDRLGT